MSKRQGRKVPDSAGAEKNSSATGIVHPALLAPTNSPVPLELTADNTAKLVQHLEATGDLVKACKATFGFNCTGRITRMMKKDPALKQNIEAATEVFGSSVLDVLRREVFEGSKSYITTKAGILKDKQGNPIMQTKRDARLLLALARKHDKGLVESKQIEQSIKHSHDMGERFSISANELSILNESELNLLRGILVKVSAFREQQVDDDMAGELLKRPHPVIEDTSFTEVDESKPSSDERDPSEEEDDGI